MSAALPENAVAYIRDVKLRLLEGEHFHTWQQLDNWTWLASGLPGNRIVCHDYRSNTFFVLYLNDDGRIIRQKFASKAAAISYVDGFFANTMYNGLRATERVIELNASCELLERCGAEPDYNTLEESIFLLGDLLDNLPTKIRIPCLKHFYIWQEPDFEGDALWAFDGDSIWLVMKVDVRRLRRRPLVAGEPVWISHAHIEKYGCPLKPLENWALQ